MSNLQHAIWTLREFNLWRRSDEDMDQPDPREIGQAIDYAIEAMEELNEWRTLNEWGGTPEIINDFIKGQQSRIYAAQKAEAELHRGAITGWQNKWECAVELAAKAQADLDEERKEGEEQARLLGMGSEREAKLIAERDLWRA